PRGDLRRRVPVARRAAGRAGRRTRHPAGPDLPAARARAARTGRAVGVPHPVLARGRRRRPPRLVRRRHRVLGAPRARHRDAARRHQLPAGFQRFSTLAMFAIEGAAPFLLFAPRRIRFLGAGAIALLQILILLTGNYGFFNWIALALCLLCLDDGVWPNWMRGRLLP